jgi:hypothetical protein
MANDHAVVAQSIKRPSTLLCKESELLDAEYLRSGVRHHCAQEPRPKAEFQNTHTFVEIDEAEDTDENGRPRAPLAPSDRKVDIFYGMRGVRGLNKRASRNSGEAV